MVSYRFDFSSFIFDIKPDPEKMKLVIGILLIMTVTMLIILSQNSSILT